MDTAGKSSHVPREEKVQGVPTPPGQPEASAK